MDGSEMLRLWEGGSGLDRYIFFVKDYREEEGITQYELSERTGLSRKTVAMLEQTSGSNPNLSTLMRIAAYFNVSVEKLIKGQV